jgi:hypothetical protein
MGTLLDRPPNQGVPDLEIEDRITERNDPGDAIVSVIPDQIAEPSSKAA